MLLYFQFGFGFIVGLVHQYGGIFFFGRKKPVREESNKDEKFWALEDVGKKTQQSFLQYFLWGRFCAGRCGLVRLQEDPGSLH